MCQIHIHPTATHASAVMRLQRETGLFAVLGHRSARLVSHQQFCNRQATRPASQPTPDGNGPSAA